jgi:hypothetical protein
MKIGPSLIAVALVAAAGCGDNSTASSTAAMAPKQKPAPPGISATIAMDHHILVDQFGYRPQDTKVAVIRTPHVGFDAQDSFSPGKTYEVRRAADNTAVFSAVPTAWNDGQIEASSGDSGWWFDFSSLRETGDYFVFDVERKVRSATFKIDPGVYKEVLKAGMRMYFYQRSGFAKQAPFAQSCWIDDPAYIGPGQDTEARDITDRQNDAKKKFLSGGWFDAGDTNKYVTLASQAVHQLLTAYQARPGAFTDDFNIPESGNGIPDALDEIKWETDWLKRMQYPDGSAALKVGEIVDATPTKPSADKNPRFYIPSCTSATIAVAGMFAHAAYVFRSVDPLRADSALLKSRAVAAWNNYRDTSPKQTHCDTGIVRAGNADWSEADQNAAAVIAAVYLFALTGDPAYQAFVAAHYGETKPFRDIGWTRYNPEQGDALLFFTTLTDADPALKTKLIESKKRDMQAGNQIYGFTAGDDLYRAFIHPPQYHWGSNGPRANYGNSNLDVLTYGLDSDRAATYETRALELLHYFHGVNPLGIVYLSNMYGYGATTSANAIYHTWYWHGTRWGDALTSECGPAPGYVTGGPNADALKAGVPASLAPPTGQPPQKSYKDWNTAWPENSWAITEPGIYFQSAYVRLLSYFAQ